MLDRNIGSDVYLVLPTHQMQQTVGRTVLKYNIHKFKRLRNQCYWYTVRLSRWIFYIDKTYIDKDLSEILWSDELHLVSPLIKGREMRSVV